MLIRRLLLDSIASSSTKENTTSGSTGSYAGDGSFDSNMVIILAALLCALICALGLNSIVRCAIRCSHRFVFETPHQASVRLAATGMKKRALNEIPVVVYGGDDVPATDCPICLAEFADGEKVRVLPDCNHGFHVKCIDTWLSSRSSCPICRRSLCEVPAACSGGEIGARSQGNGHGFVAVTVHEVS